MTGANRFTFDVIANDKASADTNKITASVQALTPALSAAADAYERMAAAQSKLSGKTINAGANNMAARQAQQASVQQERADRAAEQAAKRRSAQDNADAQRRASLVARSAAQEVAAQRTIQAQYEKSIALTQRQSAMAKSGSMERIGALNNEIARTQALVAAKAEEVRAAQRLAGAAANANRTGGGSLGTGAGDARNSAGAQQALAQAHQRLAAAQRDNAAAASLLTAEQRKLDQAARQNIQSATAQNAALNTVRYALYQVAAAYGAASKAAIAVTANVSKSAIDFQSQFANVTRTTGLGAMFREGGEGAKEAAVQTQLLRSEMVELTRTIPKSFEDLTNIGSLGAQLGIAKENIVDFTTVVAKFSATTNVSVESAAQSFGQLGNLLDIPSAQFQNLGSSIAELGVNSVATESEILAVTTQIGAIGTNAGLSAPYVIGLSTAMASLRIAPYLARGATTRIFANISRAAAEGGEAIEAYGNVLGTTGDAAKKLFETNPEQFFTQFITKLGEAREGGQNLTSVLDTLGIKGSQDVQVIQRLAGSYQLLGQYTQQAADSFNAGTYLDTAFQDIALTTQASLTQMINSFTAFKDSIGQAFLAPIKFVADALNGLFSALANLPAFITAPVVAFIAAAGVLFAFRSAMAIATGAVLAFRAAGSQLEGGVVRLRGLLQLINQAQATTATTARAAAVAFTQEEVAVTGLGAAATRGAVPLGVLTAEMRGLATTAPAAAAGLRAAAVSTAGVATAAPAAAGGLGLVAGGFRALNAAIGPVGWLILGAGALIGLFAGLSSSANDAGQEAEALKQKQAALNAEWQNSGQGADALKAAIEKDTDAYKAAGNAANDANGVFKTIGQSSEIMADGTKKASTTITDLRTGLTSTTSAAADAKGDFTGYTSVLADATDQSYAAATGVGNLTGAVDTNAVAIGNASREWQKAALFDKFKELFSGATQQQALQGLQIMDPNILSNGIKAGLEGGPAAVAESFKPTTDALKAQMDGLNAIIAAGNAERGNNMNNGIVDPALDAEVTAATAKLKSLQDQWNVLAEVQNKFGESDAAIEAMATMNTVSAELEAGLGPLEDTMIDTGEGADVLADKISAASDQYSAFVDNLFSATDLAGALSESFEALGESLADNGTDFSNMTDAGRANISALEDTVNAYAATQDDALKRGEISAEQAAINTSDFIRQTMAELSNQGVDTSQLDFLNQYLVGLTGTAYTVHVGADVQPALNNLAIVQQAANTAFAAISRATGLSFKPNVAKVAAASKPAAAKTTPVKAAVPQAKLNQSLGSARQAQEAKNLEKAETGAGGAAKKGGGAAKDAHDDAAEAAKKQAEYVKDLAGYYDDLGSKIFKSVKAEGNAFKSLQELGEGLEDNGKSFNTVTENGRKNFDALTSVFDDFGKTLSVQIEQGALTADQASVKYKEFARGVYGELTSLGVPTEQLTGFFRALGVDATGWTGNSGDVQQYAGFITAAANAAGGLSDKLKQADEDADALGKSLDQAFDRYFGMGEAVDNVQSAMNKLKEGYQDNIDKVKELRDENAGLSGDLSEAQSDKRKNQVEQAISTKYGETDRAADYGGKVVEADAKISDISGRINTNNAEIATLEAARGSLTGYSEAAIDNRAALQDLQKQMLDQIEAYARTGASTEEVQAMTENLRAEFGRAAESAGFTNEAIVRYTGAFDAYAQAIRDTPTSHNITATADTSQANAALNAIPKSGSYVTVATNDQGQYEFAKYQLSQIPKSADYVITPKVTQGGSGGVGAGGVAQQLDELSAPRDVKVTPVFNVNYRGFGLFSAMANLGGLIGNQKVSRGFARGGFVPGTPPKDPRVDNLLAKGPGGFFGLRSGEYVIQEPAVKKIGIPVLDAINNGEMPGYAMGGGIGRGGAGAGGVMEVELSPEDRHLLVSAVAAGREVSLYADSQRIASTSTRGNKKLNARGAA